jgi:hypothetical protein
MEAIYLNNSVINDIEQLAQKDARFREVSQIVSTLLEPQKKKIDTFYNCTVSRDYLDIILMVSDNRIYSKFRSDPDVDRIIQVVKRIFDRKYAAYRYHSNSLLREPRGVDRMQLLYWNFLQQHVERSKTGQIESGVSTANECLKIWYGDQGPRSLVDADVELSMGEIELIYQKHAVIQLRNIHPDSQVLLIGGGVPFMNGFQVLDCEDRFNAEYSLLHNHPKQITTVCPHMGTNPHILAFFGQQPLAPFFNKRTFDRIVFETLDPLVVEPKFVEDLYKILSEKGKIYLTRGEYISEKVSLEAFITRQLDCDL